MREEILKKQERMVIYLFLTYSFILLFFCSKLSPFYSFNEWPDTNIYFNIGKAVMNGQVLYQDVFDHKGPFIFLIYGIGYLISNMSFLGVYIIQSLFFFVGILMAYRFARLYVNRLFSVIVGLSFSLLLLWYNGKGGSPEEFVAVLAMISFYLFFKYYKTNEQHNPMWMLIHGIVFTLAFLIKLNLVAFWFFPLLAIFGSFIYRKEYHLALRNLIALFLGILLASLPFILYFALTRSFGDFWHAYIEFNALYSGSSLSYEIVMGVVARFVKFILSNYVFMGMILVGLASITFTRFFTTSWLDRLAIILSFASTFGVIFMAAEVFEYYYIPLIVFAVPSCVLLASLMQKGLRFEQSNLICACFCLLFIPLGFWMKHDFRNDSSDTVVEKFSKEIETAKGTDKTLLCLGLDYSLGTFTRANIVPSVKYFFTPNIHHDVYPIIGDAQQAYVQNKKTEFVIVSKKYRDYYEIRPFLRESYNEINSFSEGETVYYLFQRKP